MVYSLPGVVQKADVVVGSVAHLDRVVIQTLLAATATCRVKEHSGAAVVSRRKRRTSTGGGGADGENIGRHVQAITTGHDVTVPKSISIHTHGRLVL